MLYKNYNINSDLSCTNITDKFCLTNTKAQLVYPVGLITATEMNLLNNKNIRKTGFEYWTNSPYNYAGENYTYYRTVNSSGNVLINVNVNAQGVRPAISLKPGTEYVSGNGSMTNPYVVE